MSYLRALPVLSYVAEKVVPPIIGAAYAGTVSGAIKRTRREGLFQGKVLSRNHNTLKRKRIEQDTVMPYRPKRLFRSKNARRSVYNNQLGRRMGGQKTRRHTTENNNVAAPDKALQSFRLITIQQNDDETQIKYRKSHLVNVKGVKLNLWFQPPEAADPTFPATASPIQVRWAIINPKTNNGAAGISTNEFFMEPNPSDELTSDFPGSGNSFAFMNRKINREFYGVLKEGHFILKPDPGNVQITTANTTNSATWMRSSSQMKNIKCWVPVKRQMKFEDDAATHPQQNIYFVWWYCKLGDQTTVTRYAAPFVAVTEHHQKTVFFTNAKLYS